MGILLGLALFGNRMLRLWCPIIGLVGGFMTSWMLGQFDIGDLDQLPRAVRKVLS